MAIALLLAAIMALSLFAFTACGTPSLSLNIESRVISVGSSFKLTATCSDEKAEIKWMSTNADVATVDEKGSVKGLRAGTTEIKAYTGKEPGDNAATCVVTVAELKFTRGGEAVKSLDLDRNLDPTTVSFSASDGSTIKTCTVDTTLVSMERSGNDITLTALRSSGETALTVTTTSNLTATLSITLEDSIDGVRYEMIEGAKEGQWSYKYNNSGYREGVEKNFFGEFRADIVTFQFDNNINWGEKDITLEYTNSEACAKTQQLTMQINSDVETPLTIYSGSSQSSAYLNVGDNLVSVRLPKTKGFSIWFGNLGYKNPLIQTGKFVISNITYTDVEEENTKLDAPSYELSDPIVDSDGTATYKVMINGGKKPIGVSYYIAELYKKDGNSVASEAAYKQNLMFASDVLDTSLLGPADAGTYVLKIKAVASYGYTDSDWAECEKELEINNEHVKYTLEGTGGSAAIQTNRWTYYIVDGGSVESATYLDGVVTYKTGSLGWAGYSTQIFYNDPTYAAGTRVLVKMNINVTADKTEEFVGHITVSGDDEGVRTLHNGDNYIEILRNQSATDATISILFGYWTADDNGIVDFPAENELTFTFSNVTVEKVEGNFPKNTLTAPTASFKTGADGKTLEITDVPEAEQKFIGGYELAYFQGDTVVKTFTMQSGDVVDESRIPSGTYSVRVRALRDSNIRCYTNSGWTVINANYEYENNNVEYSIPFGGGGDTPNALSDINTWYLWYSKDYTWSYPSGYATVTIGEGDNEDGTTGATFKNGTITIPYTTDGYCDWGVQLYYKNTSLRNGTQYAIKMNINATAPVNITINDNKFSLKAGSNDIEVYYQEGGDNSTSFSMQVAVDSEVAKENTLVISSMEWSERPYVQLTAPTVAIDGDGKVTFSGSDVEGRTAVSGYQVTFYDNTGKVVTRMNNVQSGDILDLRAVPAGTYSVRALAHANRGFTDSAEGAAISYTVSKESLKYTITDAQDGAEDGQYGFGGAAANDNWGVWGVWAGPWEWTEWNSNCTINKAEYDNGTITIAFTLVGGDNGNNWGLQINYVNPAGGGHYSFDITSTSAIDIQVENGGSTPISIPADELTHVDGGNDASFYMQVNVGPKQTIEATITISNVVWA